MIRKWSWMGLMSRKVYNQVTNANICRNSRDFKRLRHSTRHWFCCAVYADLEQSIDWMRRNGRIRKEMPPLNGDLNSNFGFNSFDSICSIQITSVPVRLLKTSKDKISGNDGNLSVITRESDDEWTKYRYEASENFER
ncbi:hypothetical protein LOAG_08122 [Loa loa]|uniref:Uncharacterized protein n=1 Tax=Loa loa TaxID=7209 RepID=A0A1S0TUC8_LOALO|nr:hypothetical protein LOAG_08122 [Loa loa]EFO20368.1 hypothetical protein LOAG_08122 [Loa loa]